MSKSLTEKTITGINWNMLNNYVNSIISIIVGIILARLLTPKDFGLIGMVIIFTGLANLFATLGLGTSVIKLKNLTDDHIKIATTVTIILSIVIFAIFYFSAPLISKFYNETRLINILRVLAVIFILKGINTISYSQIMKNLDFKTIMIINISSSVLYGIISALLAILGFGVWSLVYGRITSQSIAVIISIYKFPLKLSLKIKRKEFKDLAGYGSGVSLSRILLYGSSNVDYLIIGKFLNPNALGLYTKAFNLMTQSISYVTAGTLNVLFPAFAAVQDDKSRLRKAYLRTIQTVSYLVFPLLAFLLVDAEYVIKGLYGMKWAGSIPVFRILVIGGILRTTLSYSGTVANATGRIYTEVFQQLIFFLVLGGCALYTIRYGIEGVAFAVVVALIWMFFAQSWLALRIIESNWKDFFRSLIPGFVNLILITLVNLILIFSIEKYIYYTSYEIKLLIAVCVNIIVIISMIVFLPYSVKGDTFHWLIERYKKFIPSFFTKFYYLFNTPR